VSRIAPRQSTSPHRSGAGARYMGPGPPFSTETLPSGRHVKPERHCVSSIQQVRVVDEVGHGLLEVVAALLTPPSCKLIEDAFLPGMGAR
jgi:hypothetical protein